MSADTLTYLYECWGRDRQLLYVGITNDIDRRKGQHAKDKHWWPEVLEVTTRTFPREIEARWAEWGLIVACRPTYNRSSSPPPVPDHAPQPVAVEVIREPFGEFLRRVLVALCLRMRRNWRAIPTGYALAMGANGGAYAIMTAVHYGVFAS